VIPALMGLKKEGEITAMPSTPILAACRAWRKEKTCIQHFPQSRGGD